jgi:DNA polymerase V
VYQVLNPYKPYLSICSRKSLSKGLSEKTEKFFTNIREVSPDEPLSPGFVRVPLSAQRVSCGLFGIVNDHIESYQSLDERFVKNKASTYFFEAESDSMSPLIEEKDILIVDRSLESYPGCIVVCSLNGEMLCKRLIQKNGCLYLSSENKSYKTIELNEDSDFSVFGVVRGLAREFRGA